MVTTVRCSDVFCGAQAPQGLVFVPQPAAIAAGLGKKVSGLEAADILRNAVCSRCAARRERALGERFVPLAEGFRLLAVSRQQVADSKVRHIDDRAGARGRHGLGAEMLRAGLHHSVKAA
jgi:hypothetical protein